MAAPGALRSTLAVAARELREALRDVQVLVFTLGFPLLFYPLLFWGLIQLTLLRDGLQADEPARVALSGPADLFDAVMAPPFLPIINDEDEADIDILAEEDGDALSVLARYTSTRPRSEGAKALLTERVDGLREARQAALESRLGLEVGGLSPWEITETDDAPPGRSLATLLGLALPMVLVTSMMLAGVAPTVEVVVGERERGTLETTLLAAVPLSAVIAGKVLAVMGLLMLSTAGNALAMSLTIAHVQVMLNPDGDLGVNLDWGAIAACVPLLLLTSALAAAALTLAALPARSFKAGQGAVSSVATFLMLPGMIGVMPEVDLSPATAAIPVGNLVLLLRDAASGEGVAALPMAVALLVNGGLTAALVGVCASVVRSEAWLFGGVVPRWLRLFASKDR